MSEGPDNKGQVVRPERWRDNRPDLDFPDSGGGGGGDMETRVAKLESDVENIHLHIRDIKDDIREIRGDIKGLDSKMDKKFTQVWGGMVFLFLVGCGFVAWLFNLYLSSPTNP